MTNDMRFIMWFCSLFGFILGCFLIWGALYDPVHHDNAGAVELDLQGICVKGGFNKDIGAKPYAVFDEPRMITDVPEVANVVQVNHRYQMTFIFEPHWYGNTWRYKPGSLREIILKGKGFSLELPKVKGGQITTP